MRQTTFFAVLLISGIVCQLNYNPTANTNTNNMFSLNNNNNNNMFSLNNNNNNYNNMFSLNNNNNNNYNNMFSLNKPTTTNTNMFSLNNNNNYGLGNLNSDPYSFGNYNFDLPKTPKVETPKVEVPKVEIPKEIPKVEIPKVEIPKEVPKVEVPKVIPKVDVPKVEIPKEIPKVEVPKVEIPKEIPKVEVPKVEIPKEIPKVDLPKVEIPKVMPKVETPKVSDPVQLSLDKLSSQQEQKKNLNLALKNELDAMNLNKKEQEELDQLEKMMAETEKTLAAKEKQVPVVTYTLPDMNVVKAREQEAKEKAAKEEKENPIPQIVECTPTTPDGTLCPTGICSGGKCRLTGSCVGDCCHFITGERLPNGYDCGGNGKCFAGECRTPPSCIGECCASATKPKPDGAKCTQGICHEGGCIKANVTCVTGQCCNEVSQFLLPKGFPCHVNPCQQKSQCSGFSNYCPDAPKVEDGIICPDGVCKSGVCFKTKLPEKESKIPVCDAGQCCDTKTFTFKVKGTPCTNNPCSKGSVCMGNSADCPPATEGNFPDGKKCTDGGVCNAGLCEVVQHCEPGLCCRGNRVLANGTSCPEGACFLGKCEYNRICSGSCCLPNTQDKVAQINGYPCIGGSCINGRCRSLPACVGECCMPGRDDKLRPDGFPCNSNLGMCTKGFCISANITCKKGECCNQFTGQVRPSGFPCHENPCKGALVCDGKSDKCPTSPVSKPDGHPCPDQGTCVAGVCIVPKIPPPQCTDGPCCDMLRKKYKESGKPCGADPCKQMTFCTGKSEYCPITFHNVKDGTFCKTDPVKGNMTCISGRCTTPPPPPSRPRCKDAKACCDTEKGFVRPAGYACAKPSNPCLVPAQCDGFKSECEIAKRPDGVACPAGACILGKCIIGVDPVDDNTYHEVHVHHDISAGVDLVKVVTTRKLDGTKIIKEFQISLAEQEQEEKAAMKSATKENAKLEEKKKEEEEKKKNASGVKPAQSNIKVTHSDKPYSERVKDEAKRTAKLNHAGNPLRLEHLADNGDEPKTPQCLKGICCNAPTRHFRKYGEECGKSKNPCKMKICSGKDIMCHKINVADGEACPNGLCFEGTCVKNCVDKCCDSDGKPRPDGYKCESDGWCFNGICARNCTGDCCEPFHNFAKPDGAPCMKGACYAGNCVSREEKPAEQPTPSVIPSGVTNALPSVPTSIPSFPTSSNPSFDSPNMGTIIPIETPHYAPKKDGEVEKMWEQLIAKEHKEKEERLAAKAKAKEQNAATAAAASATQTTTATTSAALSSTASGASTGLSTATKILIIAGSSAGFVIIVAIIVIVVSSSKKKKQEAQKKRKDQETEYYYERF